MRKILILFTVLFVSNFYAQDILPLKERASVINKLQKDRFNNLLPDLMYKTDIDMWVLITREYNEDPIIKTMLPPTWLNARRTTILVFSIDKKTKEFDAVAIASMHLETISLQFGTKKNSQINGKLLRII